jgi:hypothetical protein
VSIDVLLVHVSVDVLAGRTVFVVVVLLAEAWYVMVFTTVVSTMLMPYVGLVTVLEVRSVCRRIFGKPIPSAVDVLELAVM